MKRHLTQLCILFIASCFSACHEESEPPPKTHHLPIVWENVIRKTISFDTIVNTTGHCISLINCSDIAILNCRLGPSKGNAIYLYNCKRIRIQYCFMDSVSTGVFAGLCSGIEVSYNQVKNVIGPFPRGQMVQFANVTGEGNSISYNTCENIPGKSSTEDAINLYISTGSPGNRIKVIGNRIRGGGPSPSGGGIMTGDMGGSYILVENNILVNPGSYGISIASGQHITIRNNKIYSKQQPFCNVGISVQNLYSTACYSDTVMNNEINFTDKNGRINNLWDGGNCGNIYGWQTNRYNPSLDSSILPEIIITEKE